MDDKRAYSELVADYEAMRSRYNMLLMFWNLLMERLFEFEFSIDGSDIQDLAVESGLFVEEPYDPEKHGEADLEPGDPWFVNILHGREVKP